MSRIDSYSPGPNWPSCQAEGGGILLNSAKNWVDKRPAALTGSEMSISSTTLHEMGHWVGFWHMSTIQTIMNPSSPHADFGNTTRLHEDEADGLRDNYGDSSTGVNLLLGKFKAGLDGLGDVVNSVEVWTVADLDRIDGIDDDDAVVCENDEIAGSDRPGELLVNYVGTGSETDVAVRYFLRPASGGICGDANSEPIETVTFASLAMGTPSTAQPFDWTFDVPPGVYYPCAIIDPDDVVSETSEIDNKVLAEGTIEVLSANDPFCL